MRQVMLSRRRLLLVLAVSVLAALAIGAVVIMRRPDPVEQFQAGLAALEQKDLDRVDGAIESLREDPAFESHRKVLEAGALLQRDKPRAALKELAEVQPEGVYQEPALLFAGEALYQSGRLKEAEQVFLKYDRLHPDRPQVSRWLAAIYYDLGAMSLAIEHLEKLAKLDPTDYAPHRLLATIHVDFERFSQAVPEFEKALERSPPATVRESLIHGLAKALMRERRYDDALAALEDARPDAETLVRRSECLWSLGRQDEAKQALARAIEYEPDKEEVLRWQALLLIDEGDFKQAEPVLKRLLEQEPHNLEARYQLAQVYLSSGDKAAHDLELERLERSTRLLDRLTVLSQQAIEQPYDAELRDQMADICDQINRPQLAESWRRMARSLRAAQQKP